MDKISVIIPCYNAEGFIESSINSVLEQDYENIELIVVNDGSSDTSLDVLRKFGNDIVLINQKNQGASIARNSGLKKATGEYIAFLDSDDYWDKKFLRKMHKKAIDESVKLVYCGWQHVGNYPNKDPFIPPDYELMENKNELMIQAARWPIHAVLLHRSVFEFTGFFG